MDEANVGIVVQRKVEVTVNAETLLSQAIDKGMPVDMMERLLKMRSDLKAEYASEEYARALSSFQSACPVIKKTSSAVDSKGKVRYRYASMDEISASVAPLLEKNGLSYSFKTKQNEKSVTAICIVKHSAGHSEETEFTIPIDPEAYMNAAQKVASALTYAKRYAFVNAFGIMTGDEDDDGNGTGGPEKTSKKNDINFSVHPTVGKPWKIAKDETLIKEYAALSQDYQNEIGKELTSRGFVFANGEWSKPVAAAAQPAPIDDASGPAFGGGITDATEADLQTLAPGEDPFNDGESLPLGK